MQTQFTVSETKKNCWGNRNKNKNDGTFKKNGGGTISVSRKFAYHRLLNKQGNVNHHRQQVTKKVEKMAEEKTIKTIPQ